MTKWALITGAARRIGRATALSLADAGWNIIVHYNHSREEAESLATEICARHRAAHLVAADFGDENAVRHLIPNLIKKVGSISALINNASLFELDAQDPDGSRHQAVNVNAPKILSESFYTAYRSGILPVIVNLLDANPSKLQLTSYNQSKIDAAKLTVDMALRFAPQMRVNGVALGAVMPGSRESQKHFNELVAATPLGLRIAPESVAAAIKFLIDNEAVTGTIIPIDGGMHLRS